MNGYNFTCGNITKENTKTLAKIDQLLTVYRATGKIPGEITLTRKAYDSLDKNLMSKTEGRESLRTHRYEGCELVLGAKDNAS